MAHLLAWRGALRARAVRHALLPLLLCLLGACQPANPLIQREAYVFGTRVEVSVWGESSARADAALRAVLAEFDRLHAELHAWQPSPLTTLNEAIARGEAALAVAPELTFLLRDAADLARRSDDLFNPAIGGLIGLWGFHSDEFKPQIPDPQAIAALVAAQPRMADLVFDADRVSSRNRAVQIDLGGYAKGYALDRAATILREKGIHNALINIGGNVMALGDKGGKPWRVGIQHPRAATPLAVLDLHDGEAVGTSGDYQRYFELDGRRYCHLIDPRSGWPVQGVEAVTVLIPRGAGAGTRSDVLSKPLFIAGRAGWRAMARRLDVDNALLIDAEGRVHITAALRERLTLLAENLSITVEP